MFSWLIGKKKEAPPEAQEIHKSTKLKNNTSSLNAASNTQEIHKRTKSRKHKANLNEPSNSLTSEHISCKRAMNDAKTQYEAAKEKGTITYEIVKSCWDDYRVPILIGATMGKNNSAVKDLIFNLEADPNIKDDKTGMTPLLLELESFTNLLSECESYDDAKRYIELYIPMIKTLLDAGADPHISNKDDLNVFDYAEILNISELNKVLYKYKNTSNSNRVLNINNDTNSKVSLPGINNNNNNSLPGINNSSNSPQGINNNDSVLETNNTNDSLPGINNNVNNQFTKNMDEMETTISELKLEAFKDAPRRIKQLASKKSFMKTQAIINAMQKEEAARSKAWFEKQKLAMNNNLGGGTRRMHRGRKAKKSRRHRHP
jgi:hypothetical protein